jgi:hypothetical protein
MKRLGGGGLDGDVVLRMILDSNPIPPEAPSHGSHHNSHHRPPEYQHSPGQQLGFHETSAFYHPRRLKEGEAEESDRSNENERRRESFPPERRERHYEGDRVWDNENSHNRNSDNKEVVEAPMEKSRSPLLLLTPTTAASSSSSSLEGMDEEGSDLVRGEQNVTRVTTTTGNHSHTNRSIFMEDLEICYKTDDVLVVIAITCTLNFAFVLLIWACVRWFAISHSKDKEFQTL